MVVKDRPWGVAARGRSLKCRTHQVCGKSCFTDESGWGRLRSQGRAMQMVHRSDDATSSPATIHAAELLHLQGSWHLLSSSVSTLTTSQHDHGRHSSY